VSLEGAKEVRLAFPPDLVQAIHAYLSNCKMSEVRNLVLGLEAQGLQVEVALPPQKAPENATE